MSYYKAREPECQNVAGSIELVIKARPRDLGGFTVRRVLPAAQRRMLGPFVFFDHMGPAEFAPGDGIQVRPHPHIGLATVTYLFEGEIMHRDSLGCVQPIRPGAVNLMTAGSGIVHSERAGDDLHTHSRLHGIQSWMALPEDLEETDPAFRHYPAGDIPQVIIDDVSISVIMGKAYGAASPVREYSPTLYLECRMPTGAHLRLPEQYDELAVYVVQGTVDVAAQTIATGEMAILESGASPALCAKEEARVMVIGGTSLGKRHIWWNFVSSSRERIEIAKADWTHERFASVPGDSERIPLPDR